MRVKKLPMLLTIIFFIGMIFLTLTSRRIYVAFLPHVSARRLRYELFTVEEETERGHAIYDKKALGLPKAIYERGAIYKLSTIYKNGEQRYIASKINNVQVGVKNDKSYEVITGITTMDMVIVEGYEGLEDGYEVYLSE